MGVAQGWPNLSMIVLEDQSCLALLLLQLVQHRVNDYGNDIVCGSQSMWNISSLGNVNNHWI